MGLFDTFIAPPNTNCPNCGTDIFDFQTKAFSCVLAQFKVGDAIGPVAEDLDIVRGFAICYEVCRECKAFITGRATIEDGIYTALEIIDAKPHEPADRLAESDS